jgi:Ca-activated chloride channel family protein
VELVVLAATVTQRDGSYVGGLGSEDFRIYEEGVEQKLALFGGSNVPVDLVFMIDTSASMSSRLPKAQRAAMNMVGTLQPTDAAAIMSFGVRSEVRQRFTSDRALLERAIRELRIGGTTALYTSLYVALKEFGTMADPSAFRRRALIVLSDGEDTTSLVPFDAVLTLARRLGVAVYPVVARPPAERRQLDRRVLEADHNMQALARETGAQIFFLKEADDPDGAYRRIASELSHQYALGYVPSRSSTPGAFRRLSVVVDYPGGARVRARAGYIVGG